MVSSWGWVQAPVPASHQLTQLPQTCCGASVWTTARPLWTRPQPSQVWKEPRVGVSVGVRVPLSHGVFSKLLGAPPPSVPLSMDTDSVFAGHPLTLHFHWAGARNHSRPWNSSSICTNELMGLAPKTTRLTPAWHA